MSLPKLIDNNISLRGLNLEDANGNYPTWLNDPVVTQFNSHGEVLYTKELAIDYINSVTNSSTHHVFAIIYKKRHIGNISLQNINQQDKSAEFAILIGEPSVYGKGIGFRAGKLLFDYAIHTLNLKQIYCGTSEKNLAMQHLALKLGMKFKGKKVKSFSKHGEKLDIYEYIYCI